MDKIVDQVVNELKARGLKIPALAALLDIPKDRIYKWIQEGTSPKSEDEAKLKAWLHGSGNELEKELKEIKASVFVLMGEVAAFRADKNGESVQHVLLRLQKAVQDVAKMI